MYSGDIVYLVYIRVLSAFAFYYILLKRGSLRSEHQNSVCLQPIRLLTCILRWSSENAFGVFQTQFGEWAYH